MAASKSRLILIATLAAAVIALIAVSASSCRNGGGSGNFGAPRTETVVIGGHAFYLELAADPDSRERGLMHRESIAPDGGMLFVFPDSGVGVQSFWMKNCLVDIDIIYLDRHGRITAMHRMKARAPQGPDETDAMYEDRMRRDNYSSAYPAQFAIELRSGWLDQLNLNVEDRIDLDVSRLKALAR